jgi:hypothetical protein
MLDLPEPFRPVIALKVGSQPVMTVRTAYDLKPSMISSVILMVGRCGRRRQVVGACYGVWCAGYICSSEVVSKQSKQQTNGFPNRASGSFEHGPRIKTLRTFWDFLSAFCHVLCLSTHRPQTTLKFKGVYNQERTINHRQKNGSTLEAHDITHVCVRGHLNPSCEHARQASEILIDNDTTLSKFWHTRRHEIQPHLPPPI